MGFCGLLSTLGILLLISHKCLSLTSYYVNQLSGNDGSTGLSPSNAFATLEHALGVLVNNQEYIIILIGSQTYSTSGMTLDLPSTNISVSYDRTGSQPSPRVQINIAGSLQFKLNQLTLDGITISSESALSSTTSLIDIQGSLILNNCLIEKNVQYDKFITVDGQLWISNSQFSNNIGYSSSSILIDKASFGILVISNSVFSNNSVSISVLSGNTGQIDSSTFSNEKLSIVCQSSSLLDVQNCTFSDDVHAIRSTACAEVTLENSLFMGCGNGSGDFTIQFDSDPNINSNFSILGSRFVDSLSPIVVNNANDDFSNRVSLSVISTQFIGNTGTEATLSINSANALLKHNTFMTKSFEILEIDNSMVYFQDNNWNGTLFCTQNFTTSLSSITISTSQTSFCNANITTTSSPVSPPSKKKSVDQTALIGGVILAFALIAIIIITVLFYRNHRKQRKVLEQMDPVYKLEKEHQSSLNRMFNLTTERRESITVNNDINNNNEIELFVVKEMPILTDIEIQRKIGDGKYGEVFKGAWNSTPVALKKLKNDLAFDEFFKESNTLHSINHPNCVSLLGIYEPEKGTKYLVTEYLTRGSLKEVLLEKQKKVTIYELLAMCYEACKGLAYLESKNVVHRDVAMRNLLVTKVDEKYVVKVSDFGLARSPETYNIKDDAIVPAKWASPEALESKILTSKNDVWAFGVTVWEVFSFGQDPFDWYTNRDAVIAILNHERLPKPKSCPDVIYTDLMMSCWEIDAEKRPTFAELSQRIKVVSKAIRKSGEADFMPRKEETV